MKKFMISILLLCFMLQAVAFASTENKSIVGGDVITYSGQAEENTSVTFTVLNYENNLDDFMIDESGILPIAYREVKTNDSGKYSVTFNIGPSSDTFNVYIGRVQADEPDTVILTYINETENSDARTALFAEGADVEEVISSNAAALGVKKSLELKMDEELWTDASDVYTNSIEPENNIDSVLENVNKSVAIALFNNDDILLFGDETEQFYLPETVAIWLEKDYMTKSILSEAEGNVKKTAKNFENFDEFVAEAVGLAVVENADGYGEVKKYLKDNSKLLGINSSKVTDALCKTLVGNKYVSIEDMDIDNFVAPSKPSGGSVGSKPSGSSGGGIGGGSFTDSEDKKPLEPIVTEIVSFDDISDFKWAEEAITELYKKGIINGKDKGVFAPRDNVLREEFVKIIINALGFENIEGSINFNDVSTNDWYYEWVKRAYLCGVVSGQSAEVFGSGNPITRQDMAVMCYNALLKAGKIVKSDYKEFPYNDKNEISEYAVEAVKALSNYKVVSGNDANCFAPKNYATRAEAAQMIYNLLNYISE